LSHTDFVDYHTADVTAQQSSDYEMAAGTLSFAPGESQKQIHVLIVDDGYAEGTETFSISLSSPANNAVLGSNATAIVSIIDNDTSTSSTNPLADPGFFVKQQYLDFLGRSPDSSGLSFWSNEITSCGDNTSCVEVKRINVSAAFFLSVEFQETGFSACLANKAAYASLPSYARFTMDAQTLRNNFVFLQSGASAQLESNKQLYYILFVTREDFRARYDGISNDRFVDALLANSNLTLSSSIRQALIDGLNSGMQTRATVLRAIAENISFRQQQFTSVFVLMEYFGYLRRDPDTAGFNFWLNKLNSFSGDFISAELVKAFLKSSEYTQRFGAPTF